MRKRPLSLFACVAALVLIAYPSIQLLRGDVYVAQLNDIDGTTLIMIGALILRGSVSLRSATDLQAASVSLIVALSFVFSYEAIYKLSFFIFLMPMPPHELREFVIQVATAGTILAGFAFGKLTLSRWSMLWLGLFAAGWLLWMSVGYPQLNRVEPAREPLWDVQFTKSMVYVVNRFTKLMLCIVYISFYPSPPGVGAKASKRLQDGADGA